MVLRTLRFSYVWSGAGTPEGPPLLVGVEDPPSTVQTRSVNSDAVIGPHTSFTLKKHIILILSKFVLIFCTKHKQVYSTGYLN